MTATPKRPITYNLKVLTANDTPAPAEMDLEPGTAIPRHVWALLGQRDLVMVGTEEDMRAEFDDLDDKYRPAQLVHMYVPWATWVATRDVGQDPVWFGKKVER